MLQSQRPKATQEEIKQISDSDWRKSSMEKRQIYVDRWAGKAGPHETNTVSSAMEDSLELGIWGSENWRPTLTLTLSTLCDPIPEKHSNSRNPNLNPNPNPKNFSGNPNPISSKFTNF